MHQIHVQPSAPNIEETFDPVYWMSTVMSLSVQNLCAPIDGSLKGLTQESEHFRKSIVDKLPLMREKLDPGMLELIKTNINNRDMAFRSTIGSLSDFEKISKDIKRDLETVDTNLTALGEISVFLPGINQQLQMLNTTGNTLARVESAINSAKVKFVVAVKEEYKTEVEDKKADLKAKYKSYFDRQQYQLKKANENKQRIEAYNVKFEKLVTDRDQLINQIRTFIENDKIETKESDVIIKVNWYKKQYFKFFLGYIPC